MSNPSDRSTTGESGPAQDNYSRALTMVRELAHQGGLGDERRESQLSVEHPDLAEELRRALQAVRIASEARIDAEIDEFTGGFLSRMRSLRDTGFRVANAAAARPPARPGADTERPIQTVAIGPREVAGHADEHDLDEPHDDLRVTALEEPADLRRTAFLGGSERPLFPSSGALFSPPPAKPFRPARRPPQAVLMIMDDEQSTGETVRLRGDRCTIGRTQGDVVIPHDTAIDSEHAEIVRRAEEGGYRWLLRDLDSAGGCWVLAVSVRLKPADEFMIGRSRFRFTQAVKADELPRGAAAKAGAASLAWQTDGQTEQSCDLRFPEYWIGRHESVCRPCVLNDPLVEPKHALLQRERDGRWLLKDAKTVNGTWVRVREVPLIHGCSFQLGEQRFRVFFW